MKFVVGMAGLGKTTLVQQVYDDAECCAWVRVSPSHTIKDEHLRCMMEDFSPIEGVSVLEGMDFVRGDQLWRQLKKFLTQKRYVLVVGNSSLSMSIKQLEGKKDTKDRMLEL